MGELRRIGGLEMKGREVGIMKGWKAGEVIGNHTTTLSISTSKIRLKSEAKRKGAGAGNASYQRPGSLRVSSPGRSGGAAGKGSRACNYVSGI